MCDFGGRLPTSDVFSIACCNPDDGHEYCQASATNKCSQSYDEQQHTFFTQCPKITPSGCGLYNTNGSFVIEASTNTSSFTFDGLRYKDAEYKVKSVDTCYYQVQNPTYYYVNGSISIKFTKIEEGVNIYLNGGSDVYNSSMQIISNNQTVTVGSQYSVDQSTNFIVTAVPKYNNYNTSFTFEYFAEGIEYPWYELFYY